MAAKNRSRLILLLGLLATGLSSCLKDSCESTQIFFRYDPLYMTRGELDNSFAVEAPRALEKPGKIYYYQDYLLVNELEEGIHILDNKDPQNPVFLSFVHIPGNVDMAVRGDLLYADNYVDLLTIDISDPRTPELVNRSEEAFPNFGFDAGRGFIVKYEQTEVSQEVACSESMPGFFWQEDVFFGRPEVLMSANSSSSDRAAAAAVGIGGSLARFTISSDHLYTIDNSNLHVFSLRDPESPIKISEVGIGWAIETIFPYQEYLFIGSRSGMFIFDNSNPAQPFMLSVFQHANACDPVFVDGNIAYVTLRDGTECESFTNQLDVVDIASLTNPKLLRSYPMHHPIGLSVLDDRLYLCEDDQGLKVFDVSEWERIAERLVDHEKGFTAYDVITLGGDHPTAMVIGQDGLYQFDISDPSDLKALSVIPVTGN